MIHRSIRSLSWFVLITVVVLARMAEAVEYRSFTNESGKVISARVVQYDAEGGRVQLELKNFNKAWIPLSDLSEADQAYIRELISPTTKTSKAKSESKALSEKEIETIAEQYVEALETGDFEAINSLFYKPLSSQSISLYNRKSNFLKKVKLGRVEGNNIAIKTQNRFTDHGPLGFEGWLQLTYEGKIKYCPLIAPHPVEEAVQLVEVLFESENPLAAPTLDNLGIPTFGLRNGSSKDQVRKCRVQIYDWLIDNGGAYDNSEPKLFLPKKQMKIVERELKSF